MNTAADLMEQLQVAWQSAARRSHTSETDCLDVVSTQEHSHASAGRRRVTRCVSHCNPDEWVRVPIPDRPGWLRARCAKCGVFIGDAPLPSRKSVLGPADAQQ